MIKKNDLHNIFNKKKVLVTGHTGFKGTWLTKILEKNNANVLGISLPPNKDNIHFNNISLSKKNIKSVFFDIRDNKKLAKYFKSFKPEIVFHLAAQSLVKKSYEKPSETISININTLLNVCENILLNKKTVKYFVCVTSDKCYLNKEWDHGYRENDEIGGTDPYSSSKAACENIFKSYNECYFIKNKINAASVRGGNVIGGGDWSQDRLIPDIIRSIKNNKNVKIRSKLSTRPWQHVLSLLSGYILTLKYLQSNKKNKKYNFNFGPKPDDVVTVDEVISIFKKYIKFNTSYSKNNKFYETNLLQLNIDRSEKILKWKQILDINDCLKLTSEWYSEFLKNKNINSITNKQIDNFFYD